MARSGKGLEISRRRLLIGGGAGIGLVVAWTLWPRRYAPNLRAAQGEHVFNAFLKIGRDGRIVVAVPQAEAGQGVYTGLPQILADELGADWRTVAAEPAPIGPLYANTLLAEEAAADSALPSALGIDRWAAREYATRHALMLTGGSSSVRGFEARLREAGAGGRALLAQAAARRWNVDWRGLDAHDGFVWRDGDRIAFADLAEAAADEELPDDLPLRGGEDNRLTGRPLPRLDIPSKIDGSAMFAADVRLPGMVHAAVRSAPRGGRLLDVDREAGQAVFGVLKLIENPDWVAVAASNWWAAGKALDALRPRFSGPADAPDDAAIAATMAAALDAGDERNVFSRGKIDGSQPGASALRAYYSVAPAPSAPIEPLTATARFSGDRLEIWAPAMAPELARAAAARAAGLPEGRVALYQTLVGGGYGRKLELDAVAQAAAIAVRLDTPVQLTWPRIQEIQQDSFAPPAAARIVATVRAGRITGWRSTIAAPDSSVETAERLGTSSRFFRPDGGPTAGAMPPYAIDNVAIGHVAAAPGIATGIARGGGYVHNCFFTESYVDELARLAGGEPFTYRMQMLGDNPRLARVLGTATSLGGWDGGGRGSGMGIACLSAYGSHIAVLVEIELSREQRIRVLRALCAADVGRMVNPEIVKQQIEGGFIHGLANALGRPLGFAHGIPAARRIGDHGLPILADSPDVSVELVESDEEPGGVTDLAVPVAAPAIANAVQSLTGARLRSLPLAIGNAA
jgi:isoquinoline 1-oxidoreductase beta subunit